MTELVFDIFSTYTHKLEYYGGGTSYELYLTENSLNQLISIYESFFADSKIEKKYPGVTVCPIINGDEFYKKQIDNLKSDPPFFEYMGMTFKIIVKK